MSSTLRFQPSVSERRPTAGKRGCFSANSYGAGPEDPRGALLLGGAVAVSGRDLGGLENQEAAQQYAGGTGARRQLGHTTGKEQLLKGA